MAMSVPALVSAQEPDTVATPEPTVAAEETPTPVIDAPIIPEPAEIESPTPPIPDIVETPEGEDSDDVDPVETLEPTVPIDAPVIPKPLESDEQISEPDVTEDDGLFPSEEVDDSVIPGTPESEESPADDANEAMETAVVEPGNNISMPQDSETPAISTVDVSAPVEIKSPTEPVACVLEDGRAAGPDFANAHAQQCRVFR